MPEGGVSVYFTIQDGASAALKSIGDKTKALDKETQQLTQATAALAASNKSLLESQSKLQAELTASSKKVKEATRAYEEHADAISKANLDGAVEKHAKLKQELSEVNSQLNSNKKTYNEYLETIRKGEAGGLGKKTTLTSMAKGLAGGQIGQMFSAALGGALSYRLSSAIGVPEASRISSTLSNAIGGIAAGAVAGIPGMIAGGIVGTVSGLLSGNTEIEAAKDEAFKDYYLGLYDDVNAATDDMISLGSGTAGSREQEFLAFSKLLGGQGAAESFLGRVQAFSAETNYGYDEITGYSKQLLNTYGANEIFGVLRRLSDATAGLSLSSSDVESMISGLNRMRTTGKATTEYLNFFSERGVYAYSALGSALGVDKSKVAEMLSKGEIGGEFASEAILSYIDSTFGGLSESLMGTFDAMTDNLDDIMTSIEAAGGEGYNEMRKSGLQADADAYGGALGEAMMEMNRISGENAAYLDNLAGQYQREALAAVLLGEGTTLFNAEQQSSLDQFREEFVAAKEAYEAGDQTAAAQMENAKENAIAIATAAYDSSDAAIALRDAELDQIGAIRENTAGLEAATSAYLESVERSKGFVIITGSAGPDGMESYTNAANNAEVGSFIGSSIADWFTGGSSHAYGLDYVPYDGYPALLHEGERVLTASEARTRSSTPAISVTVSGNSFTGTGEEMADQLAEIIVRKLERAAIVAIPS